MTATMEGVGTSPAPDTLDEETRQRYVFAVITKVPAEGEFGNLATSGGDVWVDAQATGGQVGDPARRLVEVIGGDPMLALFLQVPVFHLGEIVILDEEYGREVIGTQRKPSEWSVDVEHFADVYDAIARSQEVTRHAD